MKNFEPGFAPVIGYDVLFEVGPGLPNRPEQAVHVRYPKTATAIVSLAGSEGGAE